MNYINRDMLNRCTGAGRGQQEYSAPEVKAPVRRAIIWYDERNTKLCRAEIVPGGKMAIPLDAMYCTVEDIHDD